MSSQPHWERVYQTKSVSQLSWHRAHLDISLRLIEGATDNDQARIIDVGAGESTLVDDLHARGYSDLTVLDLSQAALHIAQQRLGESGRTVNWIAGDVLSAPLPEAHYDVWHDRAVFHFLNTPAERAAYVRQVHKTVKPGGSVIVATFGPEGPLKCSGLDVQRYDADALHNEFGSQFELTDHLTELHETPFGTTQQFVYCFCRHRPSAS